MIDIIEQNRKYLNDRDIELLKVLNEGKTFVEAAKGLNLTRERIRQIVERIFFRRLPAEINNIEKKFVEIRKREHELFIREENIARKEKELWLESVELMPYHNDFYLNLDMFASKIKMPIRLFKVLNSLNVVLFIDDSGLPVYGERVEHMAQIVDSLRLDGNFVSKAHNAGRKTMMDLKDILGTYGIAIEVNWGGTAILPSFSEKAN